MGTENTAKSMRYAHEIAKIVSGLQLREAAEVYDFAMFLQSKSNKPSFSTDDHEDD